MALPPSFHKFSLSIGDKELAEVKALNPKIMDSALQEMKTSIEKTIVNAMGIPYELFGGKIVNYSNATAEESTFKKRTCRQLSAMMRWHERELAGAAHVLFRLPLWITDNRYNLARKLWLAGEVFQHNLAVLGKYHRLN